MPGFQSFSGVLHHFVLAKFATTSIIRVKVALEDTIVFTAKKHLLISILQCKNGILWNKCKNSPYFTLRQKGIDSILFEVYFHISQSLERFSLRLSAGMSLTGIDEINTRHLRGGFQEHYKECMAPNEEPMPCFTNSLNCAELISRIRGDLCANKVSNRISFLIRQR